MHQLKSIIAKDWKFIPDFIDHSFELHLASELDKVLVKQQWNDLHVDAIISNYREIMADDLTRFPNMKKLVENHVQPIFRKIGRTMLPIHVLDLNQSGLIKPHIDNPNV